MPIVYKITLWLSKGHPTPLEIVLMGHEAEKVALKAWSNLVGPYSHGHLISYEAESPNIVPDVANSTVHRSFDDDYMSYDDGDEDEDDWDDDWELGDYDPDLDHPEDDDLDPDEEEDDTK